MRKVVTITINNFKCKITGNPLVLNKVYDRLAIKHPNAYFIKQYMPKGWDMKIHHMDEYGRFKIGMLPRVLVEVKESGVEASDLVIIDERSKSIKFKIPKTVGKNKLRPMQIDAIESLLFNKIAGVDMPVGILDLATNAGKSLMIYGIHKSFSINNNSVKPVNTLVILSRSDPFQQMIKDMEEIFPGEYGVIKGKQKTTNRITVAMAQTLSQNIKRFRDYLQSVDVLIVDEVHLSTSKQYKTILNRLLNTRVKVGLSGTAKKHKTKDKHWEVEANFGQVLKKVSKKQLMKKGYSTEIVIKILQGSVMDVSSFTGYKDVYDNAIVFNKDRNNKILKRVMYHTRFNRVPILIITRFHNHVDILYDIISKELPNMSTEYIHHKRKDRQGILDRFNSGNIDILVGSMILKDGLNMPLIKVLINAAATDGEITVSQIMGRVERKDKSKKIGYLEDFYDKGKYLLRHSKHRINYYKKEKLKMVLKFDNTGGK